MKYTKEHLNALSTAMQELRYQVESRTCTREEQNKLQKAFEKLGEIYDNIPNED